MSDSVDHPRRYNSHPSGVEAIVICEHLTFNVGNAVKYLFRAGIKTPDPIEDLKKAAWYIARELWRLTKKPGAEELFRSECDALRRHIGEQDAELADYEKTVAALREQLREEQARRAKYQAVDGAARRLAKAHRERENDPTFSLLSSAELGYLLNTVDFTGA